MAEVDGQGERRRGLEGTLGRIARKLKVGGGGFPRPLIIGVDGDPDSEAGREMAEKMRKEWGVGFVIWLPPIDPMPDESDARAPSDGSCELPEGAAVRATSDMTACETSADGAIRTAPEKRGEDCGAGK